MAVIFSPTAIDTMNIMFSDRGYSLQSVSGFCLCCAYGLLPYDIFSLFISQYYIGLSESKDTIRLVSYIIVIVFNW